MKYVDLGDAALRKRISELEAECEYMDAMTRRAMEAEADARMLAGALRTIDTDLGAFGLGHIYDVIDKYTKEN